jgi:hypothetical protein
MSRQVPKGVEVLVHKAAVDPVFRADLLARRAAAAEDIGLPLEATEAAMLAAVPAAQLETIIARTSVPEEHRRAFLGKAAAAMLAALGAMGAGVAAAGGGGGYAGGGARPDALDVDKLAKLLDDPGLTTEQRVMNIVRYGLRFPEGQAITREMPFVQDPKNLPPGVVRARREIEKRFPVKISDAALRELKTVGELIDIVEKAVEKRKAAVESRKPEKKTSEKMPPDRVDVHVHPFSVRPEPGSGFRGPPGSR